MKTAVLGDSEPHSSLQSAGTVPQACHCAELGTAGVQEKASMEGGIWGELILQRVMNG